MPLDQAGLRIPFDNTYARLPARFFARVEPTHVAAPRIVRVNHDLAALLGLDPAALDADMLAGNRLPAGAEPIAQAYSGHQFGHFSPTLGDGRAILLGEVVGSDGQRYDIQLKGSGPTPFSRRGDGRAALGPVLREYLIGEAMHALGIPTTRALAAVTTGEPVYRETALPGAVLTRVAASHIRVGTFQFFAAQGDTDAVRTLADYAIARHYPDLAGNYRGFLDAVIARQAELVARWLQVGFIHGVMNTDNMAISGETIDYGPCAFMDAYDPATVFSSIDEAGRYAYGRQPRIAAWNLARLAEALLPLLGPNQEAAIEPAKQAIAGFAPRFEPAYLIGLRRKIGLADRAGGRRRADPGPAAPHAGGRRRLDPDLPRPRRRRRGRRRPGAGPVQPRRRVGRLGRALERAPRSRARYPGRARGRRCAPSTRSTSPATTWSKPP